MRRFVALSLLCVGCGVGVEAPEPSGLPTVVYGTDDRRDVYQVSDEALLAVASATAGVFRGGELSSSGLVNTSLLLRDSRSPMCEDEPFRDQPLGAGCTAFLVDDALVVTAGHCISDSSCSSRQFGFGFHMTSATTVRAQLDPDDVYRCGRVVARENSGGADWAVVQLDRPVVGRTPLQVNAQVPEIDTPTVLAGHPSGLPMKIAVGGRVHGVGPNTLSVSVDAYSGNSGSPVLRADTLEVIGILASGQADYENSSGCWRSRVCDPDQGCPGFESATRASLWAPFLDGVELPAGPGVICDDEGCRTEPTPLPNDARSSKSWDPCDGEPFRWHAEGEFEAGYDRGCVGGVAVAGAGGSCASDGDFAAWTLSGEGPWRGSGVGAVTVSFATDGSIQSQGIASLTASCGDELWDTADIGGQPRPPPHDPLDGCDCASGVRPSGWAALAMLVAALGLRRRRARS